MKKPVPRARAPRRLLDRVLDTPLLAHVVPRLQPEVLQRVIQTCGLEDCGELVALATPGQLAAVFDLDLWRADQPGLDEQFDADRFGVWIEVLVEEGPGVAAQAIAKMDADLVIAALSQHVRVFDPAAMSLVVDGEPMAAIQTPDDGLSADVGGYRIVSRRTGSWDAILALLVSLETDHHAFFHRAMRGCRDLSHSRPEADGLDALLTADAQAIFDLAVHRERRREKQGYVTPAQARAFFQMSRQLPRGRGTTAPADPIARAYFRGLEWMGATDADTGGGRLPAGPAPAPEDAEAAVAALAETLLDAGVLPQPARALLDGPRGEAPRLARIQTHLQFARDRDPAAYAMRSQELAYLANTIVAGCSVQGRPFTPQEASEAAVAVCNLGLENWPPHWLEAGAALPDDFLIGRDLVAVFQVGWSVLHEEVCMDTAGRLIRVLAGLRCGDRETQAGLNALRIEMKKQRRAGAPWRAGGALDVIEILDMPAWAVLVGLIAEWPVLHAAIGASRDPRARAVSASAFEFISDNGQIASVRAFMQALPDTLRTGS